MVNPIRQGGNVPARPAPEPHAPTANQPGSPQRPTPQGIDSDLALDLTQIGLDIVGIFDPTPVSDGANALISLGRGDFLGAALSGVAIIPGVGDLAKFGKLGRYVETLGKIADKAAGNPAVKNALEGAMGKIAKALQDIPQGLLDKLPQGVKDSVQGLKDAVARFDKAPGQLLGRAHGMTELAAERARRGLPAAGSAGDTSTTAMLRLRGENYFGVNSSVQNPRTNVTLDRVNAQTRTHAEADVIQQGLNGTARMNGGRAEMWVDRDLCRSCGQNGGMRSLARNLGVDELVVHSPSGTQTFTPTR